MRRMTERLEALLLETERALERAADRGRREILEWRRQEINNLLTVTGFWDSHPVPEHETLDVRERIRELAKNPLSMGQHTAHWQEEMRRRGLN